MREIKFRGIGIKSGQMIYGNCVSHTIFSARENEETSWIFVIRRPTDNQEGTGWVEVKKNTVGQYTVLKDKNGIEIYAGDIIKLHNHGNDKNNIGFVYFEESYARFTIRYWESYTRWPVDLKQYEIIGNIHQNPELLEVIK